MSNLSRTLATILAFLLALPMGCQKSANKPPPAEPPGVEVMAATMMEVSDFEEFTGMLEAVDKVDIQARVTGYLKEIRFKEGHPVKAGQVLFEIDPSIFNAEFEKADASLVQAQARLTRLEGDFTRAQDLRRRGGSSPEEYEKVAGDYAEAKAALGVAVAGKNLAKEMLDFTKVKTMIAGVAGKHHLDKGNLVKADNSVLVTVVTQDPIRAVFDIDERTLHKLNKLKAQGKIKSISSDKIPLRMGLADDTGYPYEGIIDFEDNIVDSSTGTKRLRAVFKNSKGMMTPGMFARINFQVGDPRQAVVVPEQGVGTDQGQKFVYVVNSKNEIEYRKIKTGSLDKGMRVVEEGISPGERIVVSGLQRVRPMMKVTPKDPTPAPPLAKATERKVNLPKE